MKLASRSYSVMALMVVVVSVLFEVNVANPLPKSEDDYGDFDVSKLDRKGKLEDVTADADIVEGKEISETFCFTYTLGLLALLSAHLHTFMKR